MYRRLESLNTYYNFLDNHFENGIDKIFTSRGKFRPTVLEELMYYIFRDLVNEKTENIENKSKNTNLPVISIENKTYLDKTMLEGAIATAEKIKNGNPYSLFFIVTENYDVDLKVDPNYSRIDQIYVLRKSKRGKNAVLKPIYQDVIIDLVNTVNKHLDRNWSEIEFKLTNFGRII